MATPEKATVSTSSNEELEAVKKDLIQLKADFAKLAGASKASAQDKADNISQEAVSALHDAVDALTRRLNSAKGVVTEKAQYAASKTEQTVEEHPITTLVAAFGIGFVLAKLFSKD